MTINAISSSAASQLSYASRLSGTASATATQQAGRMPPPPSGEGGGLLGALADALKSIGVGGTEDTSAAATSGETGTANAADALGSFLDNLMGALHSQSSGTESATPSYAEAPQGGPGKLSADLQSLISTLGDGTDGASTSATATDGTSALQSSFKSLLTALGGDGSDADAKLSGFLQTLASRLPSAGSSGNLINTTA